MARTKRQILAMRRKANARQHQQSWRMLLRYNGIKESDLTPEQRLLIAIFGVSSKDDLPTHMR